VVVGRVEGRFAKPAGAGTESAPVGPAAKGAEATGFPGAKSAPPKKAPAPPVAPKGGPAEEPGALVFQDNDFEAETKYTYRVRSVLIPKEEGENPRTAVSDPREYKTLERFSFAYIGGDASRANIVVYIGPRDKPLGGKVFERIPLGGWVGDVPKELRSQAPAPVPAAPAAEPGTPPAAVPAGAPAGTAAPAAADRDEGAASRFVTRYILVDIEQGVYRSVPYDIRVLDGKDPLGRPKFRNMSVYREAMDRRVTLLDLRKNRLQHLWFEPRAPEPPAEPKAK